MRIIAGEKRGCRLSAPKGMDTRPTLDRVKESLFGILQFDIASKRVLDLFAGSGGLGLEALSRYAEYAVFCDSSRESIAVIRENIKKLGFGLMRLPMDGENVDIEQTKVMVDKFIAAGFT